MIRIILAGVVVAFHRASWEMVVVMPTWRDLHTTRVRMWASWRKVCWWFHALNWVFSASQRTGSTMSSTLFQSCNSFADTFDHPLPVLGFDEVDDLGYGFVAGRVGVVGVWWGYAGCAEG